MIRQAAGLAILISLTPPAWAETPATHGNAPPGNAKAHWSYDGPSGPEHWASLGFPACQGHNQSPINLEGGAGLPLDDLIFTYRPSTLHVQNNGHTVQFTLDPGSSLIAGGKNYQLLQFHFHSQSEHTVKGETYPMEVHLVHKGEDGQLAVVGVFLQAGGEAASGGLAAMAEALPNAEGKSSATGGIKPDDLLPASPLYYHYKGSLTTPPCSEGVNWFVMQQPLTVPETLITRFQSLFNHNNRPPQPLGERALFQQLAKQGAASTGGH